MLDTPVCCFRIRSTNSFSFFLNCRMSWSLWPIADIKSPIPPNATFLSVTIAIPDFTHLEFLGTFTAKDTSGNEESSGPRTPSVTEAEENTKTPKDGRSGRSTRKVYGPVTSASVTSFICLICSATQVVVAIGGLYIGRTVPRHVVHFHRE